MSHNRHGYTHSKYGCLNELDVITLTSPIGHLLFPQSPIPLSTFPRPPDTWSPSLALRPFEPIHLVNAV